MCIRDSLKEVALTDSVEWRAMSPVVYADGKVSGWGWNYWDCLLYTSDAADERSSVDLGGRRIIKKKRIQTIEVHAAVQKQRTRLHYQQSRAENTLRKDE